MEKVIIKLTFVVAILSMVTIASTADTVVDKAKINTIKEKPIIINAVAQHYENPTLGEYQLCTNNRDNCLSKCGPIDATCRATCPVCPILIDQDVLVQGINDTLYRLPISSGKVNQTNIIRLTNEIRNIIETGLGNITANNQNNINIYQNKTSRTGGKFGLGYTEKGPCCHVIDQQRCRRSANDQRCAHKRHRTCGSQCISRVIRAKRVVTCAETNPDDCSQSIEYLPQPRRPGCQYTSTYPFINCKTMPQHNVVNRRSNCAQCYKISYIYVMRGQVPRNCLPCYGRVGGQRRRPTYQPVYQPAPTYYGGQYPMYPSYQPYYPPPAFTPNFGNDWTLDEDNIDDFEIPSTDNGWKIETRKCINDDGTVAENCNAKDEDDFPQLPNEDTIDEDYDNADGVDYDYGEEDMNYAPQNRRRYRRNKY